MFSYLIWRSSYVQLIWHRPYIHYTVSMAHLLCEKWLAANFALPSMPIRPNLCRSVSWVPGLWNFYYYHHLPKDLKLDAIAMKVTFQFWVSVSVLGSWDGQTESQVRSSTDLKVSRGSWPVTRSGLDYVAQPPLWFHASSRPSSCYEFPWKYSSGFLHDLVSDAMDTKLAEYNVAPLKIFMKLRTCGLIGGVGSSPKA